jgi:hypothetical protein
VILEVNRQRVADVAEFRDALAKSDKGALLLVSRAGTEIIVALEGAAE